MEPPIFCPNFPEYMDRCSICVHNMGKICKLSLLDFVEVNQLLNIENKNETK